ncbi:SAM-dependent methyltransferase [Skermania sp. ID1734]|uniref:SAM-dependent methyltransferase n=1 Tax=Skermania sp. ID1734 TaxID=2597516 RepID=UPI00117C3C08|nr:SAM-dependent methyltransferase [Skermania sp. ID1734]TSE00342.1 SAM-dependent methyltransferase [Skermania sp. ID1734]
MDSNGRTENDTWDVTTSVGATATAVATMRALASRRPDALFHDPYAEMLVRAADKRWARLLDQADTMIAEMPGETARQWAGGGFMVARTCYFDSYFQDSMAADIGQIVILASGLDTRAYRMDWPVGTTIFEIDQPQMLEFKAATLSANSVVAKADCRHVGIDLRHDWPTALVARGFDPHRPTSWLAEGLLGYLPAADQDRLFDNVVALSACNSRFAANYATADAETAARQFSAERARTLDRFGIQLDVSSLRYSNEGRSDPPEWFADHGWTVTSTDADEVLHELGRPTEERARALLRSHRMMSAVLPAIHS